MREIKFRAWNETRKEYCYSSSWDHLSAFFSQFEQVCLFEQFTGLHDKNGKEIYEGDVVRQSVLLSGDMVDNPVKWIDCGFVANGLLGKREAENCEVIGNIHENPELLNVH